MRLVIAVCFSLRKIITKDSFLQFIRAQIFGPSGKKCYLCLLRLSFRPEPEAVFTNKKATRGPERNETMNEKRLLFLTNDDGYASRGMEAAIRMLRPYGEVVVVAPEGPQSGMSHAFTMERPLFLRCVRREEGLTVWALNGTPVDCVKMAFDHLLLDRQVDLVLSGINHGSNAAVNILYSGTMGAAIEGSFYGCPSIGLSVDDHSPAADFEGAVRFGERIVRSLLEKPVRTPLCLNVNVPALPADALKGIRICRQTAGYWRERFVRHEDPRGREYFWLTGSYINTEPDAPDTDEHALRNGYVAVVPVQVDMTDHRRLTELTERFGTEAPAEASSSKKPERR